MKKVLKKTTYLNEEIEKTKTRARAKQGSSEGRFRSPGGIQAE